LILCVAMRGAAGSLLFHQLDAAAFLLGLAAIALAAGGMPLVRRTAPAIAFLIFMVPLPYELERNVGQPLKDAATASSTYLLQTLGQPAIRDGNLILIDEVKLGVVDACSGLKMMMTFAAFSMGAVLLMRRSRFEKIMVLLGIIPIAIAANVLRITATGLVSVATANQETLHFCHDLFGWLMMPVGLALLGLEVWILKRLVVEPA
jgi:exosortase